MHWVRTHARVAHSSRRKLGEPARCHTASRRLRCMQLHNCRRVSHRICTIMSHMTMLSTRLGRCLAATQERQSGARLVAASSASLGSCLSHSRSQGGRAIQCGGYSSSYRARTSRSPTPDATFMALGRPREALVHGSGALRVRTFSTAHVAPAAVKEPKAGDKLSSDRSANTSHSAAPPEIESSLDSLLPESMFTPSKATPTSTSAATNTAPAQRSTISRDLARTIVSVVLQQLRSGLDAKTQQDAQAAQERSDEAVRAAVQQGDVSADALHQFSIELMKSSRDPRRMPIASRLFVAAFGMDPLSLVDPTAPTEATAHLSPPPSQLLAGPNAWGVNAAGYNWASMVLSGQASPPPGLHLLQRGTEEARELIKEQQAAAIRVYATLAMRGDAQGMLGMGRILLASMQRSQSTAGGEQGADDASKVKQALDVVTTRNRVVALWTRAGEKGVAEAWFELGILSLGSQEAGGEEAKVAAKAAEEYFEKGAKAGSSQCHHALGVMHTQRAMQSSSVSPTSQSTLPSSTSARQESLDKSLTHFRQAAELGDGQSAHHVAMRYLLREEMIEETSLGSESDGRSPQVVRQQAIDRHSSLWGTAPDDAVARHWFSKGADAGFMPAMMNLAGMLYERRGQTDQLQATDTEAGNGATTARLRDLRKAETLYAKVAAQASVLSQQQQQQQQPAGAEAVGGSDGVDATAEMASFAQQALGTVQEAIKQLVAN